MQSSMANIKPNETKDEWKNPTIQLNQIPFYIISKPYFSFFSFVVSFYTVIYPKKIVEEKKKWR